MSDSAQFNFLDLGRYKILFPIGSGSFSDVYRVQEKDTDNYYSAKVCKFTVEENTRESSETLTLFREVNLIYLLNHPAILKFTGYSQTDFEGNPYPTIVTEFASNGSLMSIIELENSGLAPKEWTFIKKQICIYGIASGMKYMHSHDVIHRDLKPENILIDDFLYPKIADFGLSKFVSFVRASLNFNSIYGLKGTPLYMAPEIFQSYEYSKKSDVYAFALIVFEILIGKKPFEKFNFYDIISKIASDGFRPEIQDDVPDAYRRLIEMCWAQNPEERPSFDEIVDDLKNNQDYMTDMIFIDEFLDYVDFIDESQSSFDATKNIIHFEDFVKLHGRNKDIQKVELKKEKNETKLETKKDEDDNSNNNNNNNNDDDEQVVEQKQSNESKIKIDENKKIDEIENKKIVEIENKKIVEIENQEVDVDNLEKSDDSQENIASRKITTPKILLCPEYEFDKLSDFCKKQVEEAEKDPLKQFLLGKSLIEGENGFPIKIQLGIDYLNKSISSKIIDSLVYLARILIKGEIIKQNLDQAKSYISKFDGNVDDSRLILLKGLISLKDQKYSEALKLFYEGSIKLNQECMYKYGKMKFLGKGCKKNDNEAFDYFQKAAKNGFLKGQRFIDAYRFLNKDKSFKKLPIETQGLLISKIINDESNKLNVNFIFKKGCFNQIRFQPNKTEMLFYNSSLKSSNFQKYLSYFKTILIEIDYKSKSFVKINEFLLELKKKRIKDLEIVVYITDLYDYNFGRKDIIENARISNEISIIRRSLAFRRSIKKVYIPPSVIKIDFDAFEHSMSLIEIKIPNSVTEIGYCAFFNCRSLKQISFPSSITEISGSLLSMCSSLEQITLPPSITEIGYHSFDQCTSLKQIVIPSSVICINDGAFFRCESLEKILFDLPSSLTSIKDEVFLDCSSLKKINIPSSVISIGKECFQNCYRLSEVSIPSSVTSIGDYAFNVCTSLTQIVIPSSIIEIGKCAFNYCSSLAQIAISSSVVEIGDDAFQNCLALKQISVSSSANLKNTGISDRVKVTLI